MSLHLVFSTSGWRSCRVRLAHADAVVLLGDGVYAAHQAEHSAVHVLEEDAHIRGIAVDAKHTLISYDELVALCTQYQPVVSWND